MSDSEDESRKWYSVERADFALRCRQPKGVCSQQPRIPSWFYALYRFALAVYFFACLITFAVQGADMLGAKFLIYLTDWTYIVATCYTCFAFFNVVVDFLKSRKSAAIEDTLRYQIQWCLFNITATPSLIVTVVYWLALYPFMDEKLPVFLDVSFHLLPAIVCLVEVFVTLIVVRFVHVVYPLSYLLVYLIFAVIYWAAGGTDPLGNPFIYPIIDFGNYPGIAAATSVGVCLATLLAQASLKGLYALRVRCIDRRRTEAVPCTPHVEVSAVELETQTAA
ncbi:protein rolling stone-like [Diadema setosum]|uniref:protein rolling stone-like n=1 Tax=Diadema setosum TaxID=31175 RepID=UPI003B3A45A7